MPELYLDLSPLEILVVLPQRGSERGLVVELHTGGMSRFFELEHSAFLLHVAVSRSVREKIGNILVHGLLVDPRELVESLKNSMYGVCAVWRELEQLFRDDMVLELKDHYVTALSSLVVVSNL